MKRGGQLAIAAAGVGIAALALAIGFGRTLIGERSFAKSVQVDRGTYFRLKIKLAYKGEAQDFDIVVGCNVRQTNYRDGSRTVEIGMVPQVFGRRMSDGKAIVVRPPQACRGETTANGKAQPDLMPLIAVYDDADTLAFGKAYLSQDAYEGPLSELTFGTATIESATRPEFDEFRRTQQNVVTHRIYHRNLDRRTWPDARDIPPWGDWCVGYVRYRLPDDIRAMVRPHWPEERPRYWLMAHTRSLVTIEGTLSLSKAVQSDDIASPVRPWRAFVGAADPSVVEFGMPTRRGGGQLFHEPGYIFPPAFYPDIGSWGALPWPKDPLPAAKQIFAFGPYIRINMDFRDGLTRGFGYCHSDVANYASSINAPWETLYEKPQLYQVDGERIYTPRPKNSNITFFENDEFMLRRFQLGLPSIFGDV